MDTDNRKYMAGHHARDYIEALIDDYQLGKMTVEETYAKAENFVNTYRVNCPRDPELQRVVDELLPAACRAYRETPPGVQSTGAAGQNPEPSGVQSADAAAGQNPDPEAVKQRNLAFWKGLKDCDQMLFNGHTFTEYLQEYLEEGVERYDPVEYTDEYLAIEPELERQIREETGEGNYLGYCHYYWSVKKRILWEKYGIEWHSPAERYPGIFFD